MWVRILRGVPIEWGVGVEANMLDCLSDATGSIPVLLAKIV